ncbi:MAG: helix-turn-helix domain-containing protein [Betaproteobacteria bacterium]|jgi:AraC-like DNA-binding protein|nr:AraC family transcriptional regulator [Rhodocyclaceae bacterium]MCA3134112.1 AraC family transcriptional regulator [Rhodocyclaceae bacterium]MCA3142596.1 AraC family transcriptional regulator [Rhodocyclaceae bacterium]MCA3144345.1 AraC family transcriptional regulator [Rhodocyclaceae bacterium]MCE2897409.1 helix-turn-helix domain-containing protein [Betaproteobacteria bacterium]
MQELLVALGGFSVGIAALLALGLATAWRGLDLSPISKIAGFVMLAGLACTAWQNVHIAQLDPGAYPPRLYGAVLFIQSFAFYVLLRGLLRPDPDVTRSVVPMFAAVLVAGSLTPPNLAIPVSLAMGTGLAVHLAALLYRMRAIRRWFRIELPVLALFALMGVIGAGTGLSAPMGIGWEQYALIYSTQIALGFALVTWLLWAVPDIVTKTREAVEASYARSFLDKVDVSSVTGRLRALFEEEHVYRDESLNLARTAELVGLSPHQLSELINTHYGVGFSRFVRQHRVCAARRMLVEEPRASVLSVGLSVGFGSQSTFYVAFRDEVGVVPGEYRRRELERLAVIKEG